MPCAKVLIHLFWLSGPHNNSLHSRQAFGMRLGKRLAARYQARRLTPSFETSIDEYSRNGKCGEADQNHSDYPSCILAGPEQVQNSVISPKSHDMRLSVLSFTSTESTSHTFCPTWIGSDCDLARITPLDLEELKPRVIHRVFVSNHVENSPTIKNGLTIELK
jgi:hypothetical protein